MGRQRRYRFHYDDADMEHAKDPRLPPWLRLHHLTCARMERNGHALFKPGEISRLLEVANPTTGELRPMDKYNVRRAIADAIRFGYLRKDSGARCLVVPGYAVERRFGPDRPCPWHDR